MKKRRAKSRPVPVAPAAAPVPRESRSQWLIHAVILLSLLLANLALYHRTTDLGFLSVDDPDYVQNNGYIEKLDGPKLKFILTQPYAANYAPANILSYALDVALAGGKDPSAIHLSSLMWHGWVVCMVYFLAFTIRPNLIITSIAAILFMLHPAHVEAVAWISSRKDLVATGFAVLAFACYLRARKTFAASQANASGEPPSPSSETDRFKFTAQAWYIASLLSFFLASAGKQSVLLLPAAMLVWDVLVEKRRSWKMFADKIPFGLITIFFGWMTWRAQPSTNQSPNIFILAASELANLWLLSGLGKYVLYRPAPDSASWRLSARILIVFLAIAFWALPLFLLKRKSRVTTESAPSRSFDTNLSRGILVALAYWVLLQMIPPMVLSFLVPITDRYLFLPSVGVCIFLAVLLDWALRKKTTEPLALRSRLLPVLAVLPLAAVWGLKTSNYVGEWSDPRSVWYGAHFKTKNSQVSQFLGEIYHNAGDRVDVFVKTGASTQLTNDFPFTEAVLHDKEQFARLQDEWRGSNPNRTNSTAYRDLLWKDAWEQYQDSAEHRGKLSAPNLYMNRGRLLVSEGKFSQAVPEFQIALAFAKTSSYDVIRQETVIHALRAIGTAYWHMHNYKAAVPWFVQAQEVQLKSGKPWIATLDDEVQRVKSLAATQP